MLYRELKGGMDGPYGRRTPYWMITPLVTRAPRHHTVWSRPPTPEAERPELGTRRPSDPYVRVVPVGILRDDRPIARTFAQALSRWRTVGLWWALSRGELAAICPETAGFIGGLREYEGDRG